MTETEGKRGWLYELGWADDGERQQWHCPASTAASATWLKSAGDGRQQQHQQATTTIDNNNNATSAFTVAGRATYKR